MKFTGERMIPEFNKGSAIHIEHVVRYLFASQFVKDKVVLDIACGSGYGSEELFESGAKKVIGVDISEETIKYCQNKYTNKDIEFKVGSVDKIPALDNSIDVIVSFETIEHVNENLQKEFFRESKRVLKKNGALIVSTPNSNFYPSGNEFHIKEFNEKEFKEILKEYFSNISFYYQSDELGRGIYMVAVCSNGQNVYPHDPGATFFQKIDILSTVEKNKEAQLKIEDLRRVIDLKNQEIQTKDQCLILREQKIKENNIELSLIYSSRRWRTILFIRRIINVFFPKGSPQRKIAVFLFKIFLKAKKLILSFSKLLKKAYFISKNHGLSGMFHRAFKYLYKRWLLISRFKSKLEVFNTDNIDTLNIKTIKEIKFNEEKKPTISIIIPVFNKWKYTYNCLDSLIKNINGVSFEVIVVDDGSTDETGLMVKKIKNLVYVKNASNLGFVGSCNNGAKKAKGKYVVFLNNDTYVKKGWLGALFNTFENNKNIGLVGSKLIYPDGRLQEAGGIVWENNNAWNYGRYQNPNDCEFNYLKDIDYCSGASIMLPKAIFEKLGGFDTIFSPGYFEDTDLAFRVRQLGLRTVYQPKSELIHFEGITSGNDFGGGMKKYQEINKGKFFKRWHDLLKEENFNDTAGSFLARDRSKTKKVVLFMDNNIPTFDTDAGSFIAFQYLKILNDLNYKVIFWPLNLAKLDPYTDVLQQLGVEVVYGNKNFSEYIKENGKYIDFAFISRPHVASECLNLVKQNSSAKILYIAHDLHFLREMRDAEVSGDIGLKNIALETKKTEEFIFKEANNSLFFSDKEVEIVNKEFIGVSAEVIPWIQEIENNNPANFKSRNGLMFIGGYNHKPNVDAVLWFHKEIFPRLVKKIPNIEVTFYGSQVPKEIMDLNTKNFKIAGFIKEGELKNVFNSARIFIAPLRFGAGFKGKIAKAMSNGLPVVTTEIGAEGIGLIDMETAYITNNPTDFANKIEELYGNEDLWNRLSINSIRHVKDNFSVQNAENKLGEILNNYLK
jgi:O-antigen biosynthesis protein